MPLSIPVLSDLIKAEIESSTIVDDATELQKLTDAIATGVVNHLVAAAVTSTTIPGGSSAGTYPGTIS